MFSLMFAPLNKQRVGTALALDGVAAIAGIPDEGVVAGAEKCRVIAAATVDEIVAGAALDDVIAVAAIERELDLAGLDRGRVDGVVAGETIDDERVVGSLDATTVTCAASPLTVTVPLLLATLMLSSPAVPLTFTVSAAPSPRSERRQVDGHLGDAGTGQIVYRDRVGTSDSREH